MLGRFVLFVLFAPLAVAQDFAYECDVFPEQAGFTRDGAPDNERELVDGWLVQHINRFGPGPHIGENDAYRRSLSEFSETERFFAVWRVTTTGPNSELPGSAPTGLSFAGDVGINYHFTIADDKMKLRRDSRLPIHYVDFEGGVPHEHRLELYGPHWFEYLIDGEVVVTGVPEGQYPTIDSRMIWWGRYYLTEHTTRWDYLRWGQLAAPEFDCDGIKRFRARCVNRRLKGKIRTSLPPGTELHLTNNGDRRTLMINDKGRARTVYRHQTEPHTLLVLDCPHISRGVDCGS